MRVYAALLLSNRAEAGCSCFELGRGRLIVAIYTAPGLLSVETQRARARALDELSTANLCYILRIVKLYFLRAALSRSRVYTQCLSSLNLRPYKLGCELLSVYTRINIAIAELLYINSE